MVLLGEARVSMKGYVKDTITSSPTTRGVKYIFMSFWIALLELILGKMVYSRNLAQYTFMLMTGSVHL